jgi:hypothetical protein
MGATVVGDVEDQVRLAVLAAVDPPTMHYWKWCRDDGSGMHWGGIPRSGVKEVRVRPTSTNAVLTAVRTQPMEVTYTQWPRSPEAPWQWTLSYYTDSLRMSYVEYRFATREAPSHFEEAAKAAKLRKEMMGEIRKPRKPRTRRAVDKTL